MVDEAEANKEKQQLVKGCIISDHIEPPVNLLASNVDDFECFLMSLRKKDGAKPGK
ncbi:hypothetical protein DVH05_001204 [Phytophthora capsici]|nr:hypothetical protein DVH05_001204 [Phytophthora capsici]